MTFGANASSGATSICFLLALCREGGGGSRSGFSCLISRNWWVSTFTSLPVGCGRSEASNKDRVRDGNAVACATHVLMQTAGV